MSDFIKPDICTSINGCKPCDYCVKCSHAIFTGVIHIGRNNWPFEFNPRFGPTFLTMNGEPRKRQPIENNAVWGYFETWYDNKFRKCDQ